MDRLNQMGVDLGEALDKNPDGTMWAYAVVTAAQRDYLAKLGFRPGTIVQTSPTPPKAQAEMAAPRKEMRALHLAKSKARRMPGGRRRDAQDHARRLLPELVRNVALGRGQVERGSGERRGAAGNPGLPGDRQQPLRRLRRLDDRRLLGQPGRRRVRAEHCRLPGAGRHLLHRRREHLRARVPDEHEPAARRRRVPLPLPPGQARPQGRRRDRAAPADRRVRVASNYGSVQTRPATIVHRHAAAVSGRFPARLLHALPDARGRDGDDPGAARAVPGHHAAHPGDRTRRTATAGTRWRRSAAPSPTSGGNTGLPGTPGASPAGFATPSTCTGAGESQAARAVVLNTWNFGEDDQRPDPGRESGDDRSSQPGRAELAALGERRSAWRSPSTSRRTATGA